MELTTYGRWPHCVRISDGHTELVVTTDVGPRIIRYGFIGGQNLMKEFPSQLGKCGGPKWRIFGGHRLWTAPEDRVRSYAPDNEPVEWTWRSNNLVLRNEPDPVFGLAKEIRISYAGDGSIRVAHRIINRGRRAQEIAPWALTAMAPGGEAIFPQEPFAPHPKSLLPARPLVLWSYTRMNDSRWTWGDREIRLRQDETMKEPQKVGFLNTHGWMAYLLNREVFIKRHPYQLGAAYPDQGCNVETFTNNEMLELESLGPLVILKPRNHTDHVEQWGLFRATSKPTCESLSALAMNMT